MPDIWADLEKGFPEKICVCKAVTSLQWPSLVLEEATWGSALPKFETKAEQGEV